MLVDDDVLIDAGTGIGDLGLPDLNAIRHVFLTHAHLDHIAGLPMLVDSLFDENFEVPLTVYGRRETLDALQAHLFNDVIWPDFRKLPSPDNPILRFVELFPGDVVAVDDRKFHAVNVTHSVPALGFTVQNSQGAFGVSGDTKTNETLWPALNAIDDLRVLVIEVSFPDELEALAADAGHYCPKTMTRDLKRLRHSPDIWLTGMKPGAEQQIFEQVLKAEPGRNIQMLSRGTVLTI
ncbi:MAG: 3',5'-cyclic-nucleotide phosphodiesterase [Pseudomonadota bacterium]